MEKMMAEMDDGILAEFAEFMKAKQDAAAASTADDDEVEIWNEKGQGARVRRSVAKPFLQSLGIDLDPVSDDGGDTGGKSSNDGDKAKPKGRQSQSAPANGVARKYFIKS
jgi:hypothetical protein